MSSENDKTQRTSGYTPEWAEYLEGLVEETALPRWHLSPTKRCFRRVVAAVEVSATAMDEFAWAQGCGKSLPWIAMLSVLLHRYMHKGDVLIGTPERRVGHAQAWRCPVSGDKSVRQLIEDLRSVQVQAVQIGETALSELAVLRPVEPFFHAGFFLNDDPDAPHPHSWWTDADLTLVCRQAEPTCVELAYNAESIASDTSGRIASHLANLIDHVLRDPDCLVRDLELFSRDERRRVTVEWNATVHEVPAGIGLHQRINVLAAEHADATAVVYQNESITFAELNARANQLAHFLSANGVRPGSCVGLCLERSADSVVAQMGIIKAGAAVLFLDPGQPAPRVASLLERARAECLVSRASVLKKLGKLGWREICVDRDAPDITASGSHELDVTIHADTPLLAAGTSGSTGEPKVVLCRHGALSNMIHWIADEFAVAVGDRGTWLSSPGYGISQMEWWALLACGATIHVAHDEVMDAPEKLRNWLIAESITHTLVMTPLALRLWALEWPQSTALRIMQIAGERLREWPPERLPFEVINVYGSAEATLVATCRLTGRCSVSSSDRASLLPPVGRPISNVRTYVLDPQHNPLPAGVIGELFVAGESLSLGYTDAEMTNAKFGPIAVPEESSSFVYRTGDLARYWPNGLLDICGRVDTQVKIRGSRVELSEVEKLLAEQPGVRDVVVVDRDGPTGDKRLVSYVVPDESEQPRASDLRAAIRSQLPDYMIPSVFIFLESLPMLATGKVDRRALPEPSSARPELDSPYAAPATPFEAKLAELWASLLRLDEVGVDDRFLDLGGDSLKAMAMLAELKGAFRIDLNLADLCRMPTVRQFARLLEEKLLDAAWSASSTVEETRGTLVHDPEGRFDPFPLSDMQQALIIGRSADIDLGGVGCNAYFEWECDNLNLDALQYAWQRLVERHDMLRAVFDSDGLQRVLKEVPRYQIPITDLRRESSDAAESALGELRQRMSHQVMPADRWPLFELNLVLLSGHARLLISIDLLILDAWSCFNILIPEFVKLYNEPLCELPPLEVTFRDYIVNVESTLEGSAEYLRAKQYWMERIETLPPAPSLPLLVQVPNGVARQFCSRAHQLEPTHWAQIKGHGQRAGVTPSVIIVAAFTEVLRAWSSDEAFTINFPIFDRKPLHPQIGKVIGDFTNTLLVAVQRATGTFSDRARAIQQQLWQDLEHRQFGGVRLLRELIRKRGGISAVAPVVVTSLLGYPYRDQETSFGRKVQGVSQTPQVLLDFQVMEVDGSLSFNWDSLDARFPSGMLDDMFGAYCALLDALSSEESWAQDHFALIPQEQANRILEINATDAPLPDERLLHELLSDQGRMRPDDAAVITSSIRLSYAELLHRANQVGRRLRELGAQPNELVAIVAKKGWEQYVGVFGVLTAGAAYLPIDPNVPTERLVELLKQGGVSLVLTQSDVDGQLSWPNGVRRLSIDRDFEHVDSSPLPPVQNADDLAYVIYTSGSTGTPKGVMIAHRSVANTLFDFKRRFDLSPTERLLAISPFQFDLSVFDIFALCLGITNVVPDPSSRPDPTHWYERIIAEGVTFWNSVPSMIDILVSHIERKPGIPLDSLKTVVLSGDFIPVTLPDRLRAVAGDLRLWSAGGPTETTIWSIVYPIGEVDPSWTSIPYGQPITNQHCYVLDERLQQRPTWVPGEIYFGSEVGLAKGYWRDAELSARCFRVLPDNGERVYASGDLGRYLPDGNVEILGRRDLQVKINGHRIELGEIDAALRQQPGVECAVAVVVGSTSGIKRVVAFYVPNVDEGDRTPAQIVDSLRERLSSHLIPARIVPLNALPLSSNGKLDRRRLKELATTSTDAQAGTYVEPRTPLEVLVASLVADLLDIENVGATGNLFELGGDSITATRLASRIEEMLGCRMSLAALFTRPTVAEICKDLARDNDPGALESMATMWTEIEMKDLERTLESVRAGV